MNCRCFFLIFFCRYFFLCYFYIRKLTSCCFFTETGICIFLSLLCCRSCILCVSICSDLICKFLGDRCTANHDLDTRTKRLFQKCRYRITKRWHCCCQKSRKCNDGRIFVLFYNFDKSLDRNINAKINNLESCTLEHHANQVFTDIMKVACYRTKNDLSCASCLTCSKVRFQNLNALFHGTCCCKHLRNKNNLFFKVLTNNCHGTDHSVIKNCCRVTACIQSFLNTFSDFFVLAVFCCFEYGLHFFFCRCQLFCFCHRNCLLCRFIFEFIDVVQAVLISLKKSIGCVDHSDHILIGRVNDCAVHSCVHSQYHKCLVNILSCRKAKGNVGKTTCDVDIRVLCFDLAAALCKYGQCCLICR